MSTPLRVRALLALAVLVAAAGGSRAQSCSVDFETLDFGAALLGEQRLRVLTVTNAGTASLPLDLPAQPCPEVPAFTVITNGHFDVAPGASRVIQIRFTPDVAGAYECLLDLGTNDCPPVTLAGWGQAYSAPIPGHIGLYRDTEAQVCQAPLDGPSQVVQVRVFAVLPEGVESITAAEFRIANLPVNGMPPAGRWTATWSSSLVIGNPIDGMAIAWSDPRPGPIVEIGYLLFTSNTQADWIGSDHTLAVVPWTTLAVVDAEGAYDIDVGGGDFTFNCTDPPSCPCFVPQQPLCVLQPGSLNFGVVTVGNAVEQSFTIWNQGEGVLAGFVAEDCPDFSLLAGGGVFGLSSGESRTVRVRFQPSSGGEQTCIITIGTEQCPELPCTGTGFAPEPICQVAPDSLDFGDFVLGGHASQIFTIWNAGAGVLEGEVSEDCPDFSLTEGGGPFSLPGGQALGVTVRFEPTVPGEQVCTIALGTAYCDPVTCTGSAHEPALGCTLEPSQLDFGDVVIGGSATRYASVFNTGDLPLTGTISLDDPQFSLNSGGGDFTLPPGNTGHAFSVRYTPLDQGPHTAAVSLGNDACAELPLFGRAHEPAPRCVLSPGAMDFGELILGQYAEGSFRVFNQGDGPLVGEITLVSEDFHLLSGGGIFTLLPGQMREVWLRFEPASYGPHTAQVELGSEACAALPLRGFARNPVSGSDHIGLYLDPAGTLCAADAPVGALLTLHLIATVPSFAAAGITGVEFRVAGLEALADLATISAEWLYAPAGGDLGTGIRFDFGAPQAGTLIEIGRLTILPLAYPGENVVLQLARSLDGDQLRVSDAAGRGWDVGGGRLTLNCQDPELCRCLDFENSACALSDTELDFGSVHYGITVHRNFSLSNVGYVPIAGVLQISGQYFSLTQGAGAFLLDPGETLNARATFLPGSAGTFEALITTGLGDCPQIHCHGTGTSGGGGNPLLGMYADDEATICDMGQNPGVTATVKVSAVLPAWLAGITAAEFRIDNLPVSGANGILSEYWNTYIVSGDPHVGITLTFDPPLDGPIARLGELDFYEINYNWIGLNYLMEIAAGARVVGTDFVQYWCNPGHFTFNCTGWCDCTWATPVVLSDFELQDLHGAARIRWSYAGGGDPEFRLEGEREGLSWQVAWQEAASGQCQAEDHAAALASAGSVYYRLWGRLPGEDWQPLRDEPLQVAGLPLRTALLAAHPNPFNPSVTVPFTLAAAGRARLAVYDVAGRQVRSLLDAEATVGPHVLIWDGRDGAGRPVGAGVYFLRLDAQGASESQKLVLLR